MKKLLVKIILFLAIFSSGISRMNTIEERETERIEFLLDEGELSQLEDEEDFTDMGCQIQEEKGEIK